MKHLNYLFGSMIFFSFFIVSCEKEEPIPVTVSSFTMSKTSLEIHENVVFTNTSENAISYSWNFGDGNTSTDENPTHAYASDGTFTVTLTATGLGGENSTSKTITVAYPAPVANFTMDKSEAKTSETISFINSSEHATSYSWDFGDGNTSTDENPTHAYASDGTFTVKLTATGNGGENSKSKTIKITKPPLIGKWNIVEGKYNGNPISNLTGYLNIVDDTHYKAAFDNGSHSGSVNAKYTLSGTTFKSNLDGNSLILNGYSSAGTCCPYQSIWSASLSCSSAVFNQWGGTAIGYGENRLEIKGGNLVLTSKNGRTEIKYSK